MKSQISLLFLLIIGAFLFQSTHQYRLSKRELTEYDLTNFIVGTCSADEVDILIQNLCEQTFQSALTGNFPILIYYCKTVGVGMSYCDSMNRYAYIQQNAETMQQRFVRHKSERSLNNDNIMYHKKQKSGNDGNIEDTLIIQLCMIQTENSSSETEQFCNRTLRAIQRGRYPEIKRLCKDNLSIAYCQRIWSHSSLFSWPFSKSSSLFSSSTNSIIPNYPNPPRIPSSASKPSNVESITDQERINKQEQSGLF